MKVITLWEKILLFFTFSLQRPFTGKSLTRGRTSDRNPGKVRHTHLSLQKINLRYNLMQHLWRHFTTPLSCVICTKSYEGDYFVRKLLCFFFLPSRCRDLPQGKASQEGGLLIEILEKSGTHLSLQKNKFAVKPHATPLKALHDTPSRIIHTKSYEGDYFEINNSYVFTFRCQRPSTGRKRGRKGGPENRTLICG